ncbi:hypothetical protein A1F94_006408 [Pyrenophora tritici-repentis]|uniref:Uncharacterized protein n=1 Tax=Pyrenophora tritici-repentis TaxID=45151 RepID=A0A2W1D4R5_9PLEO|nr:hypothetical protein A1F99_088700 [Pyrenophora tritici-repentis]KAF7569792.1 hypothetical protein PtrM4_122070 [Pyrenophora tritici-repentis]KAG9382487.1 hypothetical protein A1F94_006408 [Pyrenophora tritici-repentis]PZC92814.1 hypothetical protein A1F95_07767 [Pyrenophora tritici-repentis]
MADPFRLPLLSSTVEVEELPMAPNRDTPSRFSTLAAVRPRPQIYLSRLSSIASPSHSVSLNGRWCGGAGWKPKCKSRRRRARPMYYRMSTHGHEPLLFLGARRGLFRLVDSDSITKPCLTCHLVGCFVRQPHLDTCALSTNGVHLPALWDQRWFQQIPLVAHAVSTAHCNVEQDNVKSPHYPSHGHALCATATISSRPNMCGLSSHHRDRDRAVDSASASASAPDARFVAD